MATEIQKLKDLKYNTTITLGVIQQDNDLLEIFSEQIKMPFNILFRLSEEGILNEKTKELLTNIFEKLILTKKDLIDKYLRLADTNGVVVSTIKEIPIEVEEEDFDEEENLIPIIVDTEKVEKKAKEKKEKTGKELPRRYGKEKMNFRRNFVS